MKIKKTLSGSAAILAFITTMTPVAYAQDDITVEKLERQLNEQERALKQTRQNLEYLKIRQQAPGQSVSQPAPDLDQESVGAPPPSSQASDAAKVAPILAQPGILTPRGHYVLEPSLQYDYSSNNKVDIIGFTVLPAIVVGLIDAREVDTSTMQAALTGRYGLTNRLELEAKIPYVYSHERATSRPLSEGATSDKIFNTSGGGIGDVQLGLRYQFNDGGPKTPYFIGSLLGTLPTGKGPFDVSYSSNDVAPGGRPLQTEQPTGSGFYGIDVGILAIYPTDPAVLFGGLNYTWRPSKDVDKKIGGVNIGRVDPGDSIKLSFGMGISLNEKASFSVGYQHTYVTGTKFSQSSLGDSESVQVGQLLIGYGYQLSPSASANLTLGIGVTRYAPNAELVMRIPYSF